MEKGIKQREEKWVRNSTLKVSLLFYMLTHFFKKGIHKKAKGVLKSVSYLALVSIKDARHISILKTLLHLCYKPVLDHHYQLDVLDNYYGGKCVYGCRQATRSLILDQPHLDSAPFLWFWKVLPAPCLRERMVSGLATVTLIPHHARLAATPTIAITLCAERTWNLKRNIGKINMSKKKKKGN